MSQVILRPHSSNILLEIAQTTSENSFVVLPSRRAIRQCVEYYFQIHGNSILPTMITYADISKNLHFFHKYCKNLNSNLPESASTQEVEIALCEIFISKKSTFQNSEIDELKQYIYKYFTFNSQMPDEAHQFSAEIHKFKQLLGEKHIQPELNNIAVQRLKESEFSPKNFICLLPFEDIPYINNFVKLLPKTIFAQANSVSSKPYESGFYLYKNYNINPFHIEDTSTHHYIEASNEIEEADQINHLINNSSHAKSICVVCDNPDLSKLLKLNGYDCPIPTQVTTIKEFDSFLLILEIMINQDPIQYLDLIKRHCEKEIHEKFENDYARNPLRIKQEQFIEANIYEYLKFEEHLQKHIKISSQYFELPQLQELKNISYSDKINLIEYQIILKRLLSSILLKRTRINSHVSVLSSIEARFLKFDMMIFANSNEKSIDKISGNNFPSPQEIIGLQSTTYEHFMNCLKHNDDSKIKTVFTRSMFSNNQYTKKSRYLKNLHKIKFKLKSEQFEKTPPSYPNPNQRPSELSATSIQTLLNNPYQFYIRYILKLKEQDKLSAPFSRKEFGIILHNAISKSIKITDRESYKDSILSFFEQKHHTTVERIAYWLFDNNFNRGVSEVKYKKEVDEFTLKATLDGIIDGTIIDYKTGYIPSKNEVFSGQYPQFLIESFITEIENCMYIELKGRRTIGATYKMVIPNQQQNVQKILKFYQHTDFFDSAI